ncbi:MAG: hypothetical protein AB7F76_04395 [Parvibaculaceae bacterium]|jgi:hypothetical protein
MRTLLTSASLSCLFLLLPLPTVSLSSWGNAGLSAAYAHDPEMDSDSEDDGRSLNDRDDDDDAVKDEDSLKDDDAVKDDDSAKDEDARARDDDDDDDEDDEEKFYHQPISCTKAQKVVERAGFTNVGVRSCTGKTFRFTGLRKGYELEIVVSRLGRILHTRRR